MGVVIVATPVFARLIHKLVLQYEYWRLKSSQREYTSVMQGLFGASLSWASQLVTPEVAKDKAIAR